MPPRSNGCFTDAGFLSQTRGMSRRRLDDLLVQRGLASSPDEARRIVMAGEVVAPDRLLTKPGELVDVDAPFHLRDRPRFVGRGGEKLEGALAAFGVDPAGRLCLDLGASTGGFTDCLLARGARHVVSVDAGTNQLAEKLRRDPRVTVCEQTPFRVLRAADFPELPGMIVADLSFVALRHCVPTVAALLHPTGDAVLLVKPQFELDRGLVPPGGVVSDPLHRRRAVEMVLEAAVRAGMQPVGAAPSALPGADGNRECFVHVRHAGATPPRPIGLDGIFGEAVPSSPGRPAADTSPRKPNP